LQKKRRGKYQYETRGAKVVMSSKEQQEEQHHNVMNKYHVEDESTKE